MGANKTRSFNSLVEQFLGDRLPDRLAGLIDYSELTEAAQNFIVRMLTLMQRAGYPPTEFTPLLIRMLGEMIPNTLPDAWGGLIPPLTMPGRHQKFDAYIAHQTWPEMAAGPVFIDIGCGFPPQTTLDTAGQFPDWQVIGVDRDFAPYIVYDPAGNYAIFNHHGRFQYFQPQPGADALALYAHPEKTRSQFIANFAELSPMLTATDGGRSNTFERNGHRIVRDHIRDFETGNLTFKKAEIEDVQLPSARVIRCMNVALYAKPEPRAKMLQKLSAFLGEGGILIAGTNGNHIHARYVVYRKTNHKSIPTEFAFSPDNLRPFGIMPWFTIHDNDPEATCLAQLTGAIHSDPEFWPAISQRFDDLLAEYGICRRGEDGYLQPLATQLPVADVMMKMRRIWRQITTEGYVAGAVAALKHQGYKAWENEVGDIAVWPSDAMNG